MDRRRTLRVAKEMVEEMGETVVWQIEHNRFQSNRAICVFDVELHPEGALSCLQQGLSGR